MYAQRKTLSKPRALYYKNVNKALQNGTETGSGYKKYKCKLTETRLGYTTHHHQVEASMCHHMGSETPAIKTLTLNLATMLSLWFPSHKSSR